MGVNLTPEYRTEYHRLDCGGGNTYSIDDKEKQSNVLFQFNPAHLLLCRVSPGPLADLAEPSPDRALDSSKGKVAGEAAYPGLLQVHFQILLDFAVALEAIAKFQMVFAASELLSRLRTMPSFP